MACAAMGSSQQAESDWQDATARATEGFASNAREPSAECLEGAAMLELWIADGKPLSIRFQVLMGAGGPSVATITAQSGGVTVRPYYQRPVPHARTQQKES